MGDVTELGSGPSVVRGGVCESVTMGTLVGVEKFSGESVSVTLLNSVNGCPHNVENCNGDSRDAVRVGAIVGKNDCLRQRAAFVAAGDMSEKRARDE